MVYNKFMETTDHQAIDPNNIRAGDKIQKIRSGYRIFANSTCGTPWCWYAPDLNSAKLLAETICGDTGQDVEISKYVGTVCVKPTPVEFIHATDTVDTLSEDKVVTIKVNGRNKYWRCSKVDYDDVVALAGYGSGPEVYSITFSAVNPSRSGMIGPGGAVHVSDNMVFNVCTTGNA